ncbi:MAG: TonB-dependent receptor family protein [Xanthobacteraceae bacterium]|uniref:TonB-dependent receptor family protein n=1 Tax=Pseudolabrys sp. TaxID=1960880 RepID=UPI003D0ABB04
MSRRIRALGAVLAIAAAPGVPAFAQTTELPAINVTSTDSSASLVSPNTAEARRQIEQTPGGVALVPDAAFKDTPALIIKDIVGFVPGVWAQPKWGDDTRLSIRGSSLSRNFHLRGIQLYLDGIPINTADGYGDFQEIDPSAYRYVEVYKGGNALRYGANSLGGAINLVTPTGRDASPFDVRLDTGSFGYVRSQASTAGAKGPFDWFVTGSAQSTDGYRDHSDGHGMRGSANVGYRVSDDFETRFYLNANTVRQRIPGSVTRASALNSPKAAAAGNVLLDQQRNIDTLRVANKSTLRLGDTTTLDVGLFGVDRHLMHPIFQWLDYRYADYGGFLRLNDERLLAGHRNRLVAGVNLHNGDIDNRQFANLPGAVKGALLSSSRDRSQNYSAYLENSFYVLPQLALVAGTQFLHAVRERKDRFLTNGDQSGSRSFDVWSPKLGVLWEDGAGRQVFANVSRSAEVPSFGENTFATSALSSIETQIATTYEIGTRGRMPDVTWDLAIYRAEIHNELQCLTNPSTPGACAVTNADRTVHQGIEAGLGVAVLKGIATQGDRVWLNVAYTFSDFRFDGDARYGNNQLPGAPRHYLKAEALYKHPSGFYAGPNVEWVPQAYYVDNANSLRTDAYALLNVRVGYDRGEQFSAYLEGRNLFDTRYIASASIAETANAASALFEPGTGRAIYAGIRYRM